MNPIKLRVGDTIWSRDINLRIRDAAGKIIYRAHFHPVEISGETSRSWMVGDGYFRNAIKIPKSTTTPTYLTPGNWPKRFFLTREAVDEDIWFYDNHRALFEAVEKVRDISTLKKIAELVGYKEQ